MVSKLKACDARNYRSYNYSEVFCAMTWKPRDGAGVEQRGPREEWRGEDANNTWNPSTQDPLCTRSILCSLAHPTCVLRAPRESTTLTL
jgi:hypothetical protein